MHLIDTHIYRVKIFPCDVVGTHTPTRQEGRALKPTRRPRTRGHTRRGMPPAGPRWDPISQAWELPLPGPRRDPISQAREAAALPPMFPEARPRSFTPLGAQRTAGFAYLRTGKAGKPVLKKHRMPLILIDVKTLLFSKTKTVGRASYSPSITEGK